METCLLVRLHPLYENAVVAVVLEVKAAVLVRPTAAVLAVEVVTVQVKVSVVVVTDAVQTAVLGLVVIAELVALISSGRSSSSVSGVCVYSDGGPHPGCFDVMLVNSLSQLGFP